MKDGAATAYLLGGRGEIAFLSKIRQAYTPDKRNLRGIGGKRNYARCLMAVAA